MISPYLYDDFWPFFLLIFSLLETADFLCYLSLQVMAILCCVAKNSLRGTIALLMLPASCCWCPSCCWCSCCYPNTCSCWFLTVDGVSVVADITEDDLPEFETIVDT
jgi:hypothetical protein